MMQDKQNERSDFDVLYYKSYNLKKNRWYYYKMINDELNEIPDGGWYWIIVAAVAFINMTNQSILSVFGLLFGSHLKLTHQETFTAALITNLNSLALNFSGLFIGPAIKSFQPRNVAAFGCIMVSIGLFVCAFATQGWHFIIGYSCLVGLGLGVIAPSTFMAINSYFSTKRGRAVGVSLAGAGLGQIIIPHIVRFCLDQYGFQVAVLSMSVLSLCGLLGALMLKPLASSKTRIKYNNRQHIKLLLDCPNVDDSDDIINDDDDNHFKAHGIKNENVKASKDIVQINIPHNNYNKNNNYKKEIQCQQQLTENLLINHKQVQQEQQQQQCNLLITTFNNDQAEDVKDTNKVEEANENKSGNLCNKICHRLIQAMDLELLQNPIFWSMIIGMALVYTSTINFTMIFPQFLQYTVNLNTHATAICMSIMAGADIICRLLLPFLTDKLKVPYRVIFLIGTVGLLVSRSALAESKDFTTIVVMSIFTGITKSATVLNNNLTIADYCKPEKLPGGLGLNMISKGVLVITVGQLLGWIRDLTNSYVLCLHAQNTLLLLVIIVWVPEMWYNHQRKKITQKCTESVANVAA